MRATARIIKQIKSFEALRLTRYVDSAGVDTIGFGHTETARRYTIISRPVADRLFLYDLNRFEGILNGYIRSRAYQLNQNQFDALLSFIYNVGSIKAGSNLDKAIRANNPKEVGRQLLRYVYAGGRPLAGLQRRRNYEAILYNTPHFDLNILLLVPFLL